MVEDTGAESRLVQELEDFGIIKGEVREGRRFYDETEREIVRSVSELARSGVATAGAIGKGGGCARQPRLKPG